LGSLFFDNLVENLAEVEGELFGLAFFGFGFRFLQTVFAKEVSGPFRNG
jgi:hypothetical protein